MKIRRTSFSPHGASSSGVVQRPRIPRILSVKSVTLLGALLIALSFVTFELLLDGPGSPHQGSKDHFLRRTLVDQESFATNATAPPIIEDIETELQYENDTIERDGDDYFNVSDRDVDEYFDITLYEGEHLDPVEDLHSLDDDEKIIQTDVSPNTKDSPPNTKEMMRDRSFQAKERALKDLKAAYVPTVKYNHLSLEKVQLNGLTCEQEDAFANTPVDGDWIPEGSSAQSIQRWEQEYQSAVKKIRESNAGGEELRELARIEVQRLRQIRHELFCKD